MTGLGIVRQIADLFQSNKAERFAELYDVDKPVDFSRMLYFRNDKFPKSDSVPWLDRPDAMVEIDSKVVTGDMSVEDADTYRRWIEDGYYIARNLFSEAEIDNAWQAYENAVLTGVIKLDQEPAGEGDNLPGRNLNPHKKVAELKALQCHGKLLDITDRLLGRKTVPFQTIMGHKGSNQAAHSDAIHMTTYTLGYLIAAWIAMEDLHPDSGPLEFYPGSHRRLPYLLSNEAGIKLRGFKANYHKQYEPMIQRQIEEKKLHSKTFVAKKGDVLFWHSNLLHGGKIRSDLSKSRKALVCHYFAEKVFTYHDLSGKASRLHRNGALAPIQLD